MKKKSSSDLATNRKAYHDYHIEETFEAGIVLTGTEVKSLREHSASLSEGYVRVQNHEIWLIGVSIAPYAFGNIYNHEERRERKLLMHRREIEKLMHAVDRKARCQPPHAGPVDLSRSLQGN